jgi:hypothetical protein
MNERLARLAGAGAVLPACAALLAGAAHDGAAQAAARPPPEPHRQGAPAEPAAPPPAFEPGTVVVDANGARIGTVASLAEGASGPIVVLKIDDKLVGAPQSSLSLVGKTAVSARSKAQILRAADVPD